MNDVIQLKSPPLVKISRNRTRGGWVLETELRVPQDREDVFALFADAFQLDIYYAFGFVPGRSIERGVAASLKQAF